MKRFKLVLVMLAVALVLGLAFVGCKNDVSPFEGTWVASWSTSEQTVSFIFTGDDFTRSNVNLTTGVTWFTTSGTYTYTNTDLTLTEPQMNQVYTYTYVITGNTLQLTRPEGTSYWAGNFIKQ